MVLCVYKKIKLNAENFYSQNFTTQVRRRATVIYVFSCESCVWFHNSLKVNKVF